MKKILIAVTTLALTHSGIAAENKYVDGIEVRCGQHVFCQNQKCNMRDGNPTPQYYTMTPASHISDGTYIRTVAHMNTANRTETCFYYNMHTGARVQFELNTHRKFVTWNRFEWLSSASLGPNGYRCPGVGPCSIFIDEQG